MLVTRETWRTHEFIPVSCGACVAQSVSAVNKKKTSCCVFNIKTQLIKTCMAKKQLTLLLKRLIPG